MEIDVMNSIFFIEISVSFEQFRIEYEIIMHTNRTYTHNHTNGHHNEFRA